MHIKVVRLDLTETNVQLKRIADLLEGILGATEPHELHLSDLPELDEAQRLFYTNDAEEIITHKLARLGKTYKPRV